MKRLIALSLALLLALSLAACTVNVDKKSDVPAPTAYQGAAANNPPAEITADVNLGTALGGAGKLSDADAAAKQAMIAEARRDGGDLEFRADGSTVYTDPDGSVMIQNPDGTWTYQGEDGSQAQIGGDWPDNEYTKLIPKPGFAISVGASTDESFTVTFADATPEQIKAYVEQVKAAGFTVDPETEDMEMQGMAIYTYSAQNAAGYSISVFSAAGTMGLTINKP